MIVFTIFVVQLAYSHSGARMRPSHFVKKSDHQDFDQRSIQAIVRLPSFQSHAKYDQRQSGAVVDEVVGGYTVGVVVSGVGDDADAVVSQRRLHSGHAADGLNYAHMYYRMQEKMVLDVSGMVVLLLCGSAWSRRMSSTDVEAHV